MWAWYRMMRILVDERAALVAIALLAVDFTFTYSSSVARMDMMAAALGGRRITVYLTVPGEDMARAVLFEPGGGRLPRAFTHPMAAGDCTGLFALTLFRDWRRIRVPHVLLAAVPYSAGAIGWGLYIMQAPAEISPGDWAATPRGADMPLGRPDDNFHSQVMVRFLYMFGMAPDTQGLSHIKILILARMRPACLGVVFTRELRERSASEACSWSPS